MLQLGERSTNDEMLIVKAILTGAAGLAEQAQMIRRIMSTVPDPPAIENGALAQEETFNTLRRLLHDLVDLVGQLWSEPLIGIQVQDPFCPQR
jgi:hypothetical protein